MLISCYIGMILFLIENRDWYELKISEAQVHELKEGHMEDLKGAIRQKVAVISSDRILGLFVDLCNYVRFKT